MGEEEAGKRGIQVLCQRGRPPAEAWVQGSGSILNADTNFLHPLNTSANKKFELVNTWKTEKNFRLPKPKGPPVFLPGLLDSSLPPLYSECLYSQH